MGTRWQSKGRQQDGALIVNAESAETAFVVIQRGLDGLRDALQPIQRIRLGVIEPGDAEEQHGRQAEFGQPPDLASLDTGQNRARNIAPQSGLRTRAGADRRQGGERQRIAHRVEPHASLRQRTAHTMPSQKSPCLGSDDHVSRSGLVFGEAHLDQGWPCHQELPPPTRTADAGRHDFPSSDAHAQGEAQALGHFIVVELRLDRQAALRSVAGHGGQPFVCCRSWPTRQQGITSELDDITPVGRDGTDELSEIDVEQAAHFFRAGRAALGEAFGQWGRAGDVGKED